MALFHCSVPGSVLSPVQAQPHGSRALVGPLSPAGFKFIFLTTAITNSARMLEAMIEAKA